MDSNAAKTNEQVNIAKQILEHANNSLDQAISESNMIKIKIAREMTAVSNKRISTVSSRLEEQGKVRNEIRQKRKTVMEKLLQKAKKKSYKLYWIVSHN